MRPATDVPPNPFATLILPLVAVLTPLIAMAGNKMVVYPAALLALAAVWQILCGPAPGAAVAVATGWRDRPVALVLLLMALWAVISLLWSPAGDKGVVAALTLLGTTAGGAAAFHAAGAGRGNRCRMAGGLGLGLIAAALLFAEETLSGFALVGLVEGRAIPSSYFNAGITVLVMMTWPALAAAGALPGRRGPVAAAGLGLVVALVALLGESGSSVLALAGGLLLAGATALAPRLVPRLVGTGLAVIILAMPWGVGAVLDQTPVPPVAQYGGNSAQHRLYIWDYTAGKIAERPLHGYGIEAARTLDKTPHPRLFFMKGRWWEKEVPLMTLHPHNMALQIWLELGVAGAVLAATAAALLGWRLGRGDLPRSWAAWGTAMVGAAAIFGFVGYGIWQGWLLCAFATSAALLRGALGALLDRNDP